MIVLGAVETLQLVDRSVELPVMHRLARMDTVVAVAAPALAAVADAYAAAPAERQFGLMNRLEDFLRDCADTLAPGLGTPVPPIRLLPFTLPAIRSFARLRQVLAGTSLFVSQTYAVAHGHDVPLLLIDDPGPRGQIAKLAEAGIDLRVDWIGSGG